MIQAVVDIDVGVEYGLAKALRICKECGLEKIASDSIKRTIHTLISGDVEEKIKCLSRIAGFFTVDLRLFVKLCSLDRKTLKSLGVVPYPKTTVGTSRVLGYVMMDGTTCVVEKTSKNNVVLIRALKSSSAPLIIEPSMYLIQAYNTEITEKILKPLRTLKSLGERLENAIPRVCKQTSNLEPQRALIHFSLE